MRRFNVTGLCVPEDHYMVDISGKIEQIRKLVDNRCYFTINRARQYGKTTTLAALEDAIKDEYTVVSISFEELEDVCFESAARFCSVFAGLVSEALKSSSVSESFKGYWSKKDEADFRRLSSQITELCRDRKVVLLVDEVDKISNNKVFVHFLGMLRNKFLLRTRRKDYTFHSVILAGVYDIRNIKLKLINEGVYSPTATEGKIYNSPWNIAVDFDVDMSFDADEIATMLRDYESDHNTGMDVAAVSKEIYAYTNGYPYLVSRICQRIDEKQNKNWTNDGIQEAVKNILRENSTLFDDLFKNIESSKDLYNLIYDILIVGNKRTFARNNPTVKLAMMYGFIKESERGIEISNSIFESVICEYFISKDEEVSQARLSGVLQDDVVRNNSFDMELCIRKFAQHYKEIYNEIDEKFLEREGRLLFLSYLRPLINGQGHYQIESQFTDLRRMDLVVDFGSDQFIIELKLWKGEAKHEEAYGQLAGYLDTKNADVGYLLTFDFRKGENKQPRAEWVEHNGKRIFDVVV